VKVVPFADVPRAAWEELCDASPQAWLFHRAAWVEIESRRFVRENRSFALSAADRLVGVQPLYLSDDATGVSGETLLHSGIHRHAGLALRPGAEPSEIRAARAAAMERIFAIAEAADADRIQLNVHNLAPESLDLERPEIPFWVEEYGFELGLAFTSYGMLPAPGMTTCNSDQIINLEASEERLLGRVTGSGRRSLRTADSLGLEFDSAQRPSTIDEYYALAIRSAERTGEILPPRGYYEEIWAAFAASGRCVVSFARLEGTPVAAVVLLLDKGGVSYLAGASDPRYLRMCVNEFVIWRSVLWAKAAGARRFRLGPWFPTVEQDWAIARVSRFKKKFGGHAYSIIQGSLFRHPEKYRGAAERHVGELCRARDGSREARKARV
jgi:hypothetical protein